MLTEQQQLIVETAHTHRASSVIARAGTGKTFTLCKVAQTFPPGLAIAFNKSIAVELGQRPELSSFSTSTFNALGFAACRQRGIYKTDPKKLDNLIKQAGYGYPDSIFVASIINAIKASAIPPNQVDPSFVHQTISESDSLPQDWETSDSLPTHTDNILNLFHLSISDDKTIDFSDQLYYPFARRWLLDPYPSILVDESQDLSPIQHQLIYKSVDKKTQIVTFGDPRQCIYAWRGADSNSFHTLAEAFSSHIYHLSYSFRCPQRIVLEANRIEPDFFAFPENPEGKVSHHSPDYLTSECIKLSKESAILCRNNAPLIRYALLLLRENRPFTFKGNFPSRLSAFFARLDRSDIPKKIKDTEARLPEMRPRRREAMLDLLEAVTIIYERCSSRSDIQNFLQRLSSPNGGITLSTIHQSKGLEWERVYFLLPSLLNFSEVSEQNLFYVAVTRSKAKLYYIDHTFSYSASYSPD